jgi:hypothetical protein
MTIKKSFQLFKSAILALIVSVLLFMHNSCGSSEIKEDQSAVPYSVLKNIHKEELLDWNKGLVEIDHEVIRKFIERRKWNMQISPTGLYYQIYQNSNDLNAEHDLIAIIDYKTSLLDGTVLYSSEEYGNRELHLGHNQEESGLNEGILMMRKGEKARFIMPPHLAFGVPGDGYKVPYYSILVYEIELVDLYTPELVNNSVPDGWQ